MEIDILDLLFDSFWLLMPAFIATIVPLYVKKINFLAIPINEKYFGKNKTYRGFFFGILTSILIAYIQVNMYTEYFVVKALSSFNYENYSYILIGGALGFGALSGDLAKSFFKRILKIEEGKKWIPFDNIDFVIGALIASLIFFRREFIFYVFAIILGCILHYMISSFAYKMKLR